MTVREPIEKLQELGPERQECAVVVVVDSADTATMEFDLDAELVFDGNVIEMRLS